MFEDLASGDETAKGTTDRVKHARDRFARAAPNLPAPPPSGATESAALPRTHCAILGAWANSP